MRWKFILLILLLTAYLSISVAQRGVITQQEIERQNTFLEGVKEQVIGHHEEALEIFEKLWVKNKNLATLAFEMSRSYEALKRYDKAIEYGNKAVNLDNQNEYFVMQLAESYEGANQMYNAADTYYAYTKVNPEDRFFYEKSVQLYLKDGNIDQAIQVLNELETKVGIEEPISRQKFEIYSKTNQEEKAVLELKKLANAFPEVTKYQLNLANYFLKINKKKEAELVYDSILDKNPNQEAALKYKSMSKNSNNPTINYLYSVDADINNDDIKLDDKIKRLIPVLQELAIKPNSETVAVLLGVVKKLEQQYPNEAKVHALLADTYMMNSNYEKASETYANTIALDGSIFNVWSQYMESLRLIQSYEQLIKVAEKALYRFPNQALVYYYAGLAYNERSLYSEARSILEEGRMMTGKNKILKQDITAQVALAYMGLKKVKEAEEYKNELSENTTWSPDTYLAIIQYAKLAGDTTLETQLTKEVKQKFSSHPLIIQL